MTAGYKPTDDDGLADALAEQDATDKIADARKAAHDALNAAERAWYAYAGLVDVGPDRTRAFDVYENVRNARRV